MSEGRAKGRDKAGKKAGKKAGHKGSPNQRVARADNIATNGGGTPKAAQVAAAVAMALQIDGHWPPNDRSAVMSSTYRYTKDYIRMFLARVSNVLAHGTPPHTFDFDDAFCLQALTYSVEQLMAKIYEKAI